MALNLKNAEAERLAAEVASLRGGTMTGAVIEALTHERERLLRRRDAPSRAHAARQFLELYVWSQLPARTDLTDDELLGYGEPGA